ncbi:hypothetical protein, partial [Faecalibaculum rodentium]|uniref:hypothetical protein n=1 Tax=Faecalibaculum rodentium TaxID=1702221 RepID=UPI0025886BEE
PKGKNNKWPLTQPLSVWEAAFLSAVLFPGLGAGRIAALSFCLIYSNACFFRGRMLRNVHGFPGRGTK